MVKYFICICLLFGFCKSYTQIKEYKLESKAERSDFNYKAFEGFDTISPLQIRNVFTPIKGSFTVYTFVATYTGLSFTNSQKEFHDILIIKTDEDNKIVDAYQYTLEWAEVPVSMDLFKPTKKGMELKAGLSIKQMKFKNAFYIAGERDTLNEDGIIRL